MRVRSLLVPVVAVVALLVGCDSSEPPAATNGVENLSAEDILQAASDALVAAQSFRFAGTVGAPPDAIEFDLVYAGESMAGPVSVFGTQLELVKVGADLYVMTDDTSLYEPYVDEERRPLLAQLAGRWVKVPAAAAEDLVVVPLEAAALLADVPGPLTKGALDIYEGTPVITVANETSTFLVATVGDPYLLAASGEDGQDAKLSEFNEPVTITAPAGAIDILTLLAG